MDALVKTIQPEHAMELYHYETVKVLVRVCKVSDVNFPMLYTHTVDMAMAMKTLHSEGETTSRGNYKDGSYFKLPNNERELVDERAEEICIATRLLSLSSNKKFSASKQELCNDLVQGKDNYPRTVTGVLKYLRFHSLSAGTVSINQHASNTKQLETAFVTEGDDATEDKNQKNKTCRIW